MKWLWLLVFVGCVPSLPYDCPEIKGLRSLSKPSDVGCNVVAEQFTLAKAMLGSLYPNTQYINVNYADTDFLGYVDSAYGEEVILGRFDGTYTVTLTRNGGALLHETLHVYNKYNLRASDTDNAAHVGWTARGWFVLDNAFEQDVNSAIIKEMERK